MSSAWSIGKGKRSTDNLFKSNSPGPAAYSPIKRSKTSNPSWRYYFKHLINSIGAGKKGSFILEKKTPGPGAYILPILVCIFLINYLFHRKLAQSLELDQKH